MATPLLKQNRICRLSETTELRIDGQDSGSLSLKNSYSYLYTYNIRRKKPRKLMLQRKSLEVHSVNKSL